MEREQFEFLNLWVELLELEAGEKWWLLPLETMLSGLAQGDWTLCLVGSRNPLSP